MSAWFSEAPLVLDEASIQAGHALDWQWLRQHGLGQQRPLIVAAPMAAHRTKRWPVAQWQELVRRLTAGGADVAVVGGSGDSDPCSLVARAGANAQTGGGRSASAAGVLGLQGTATLLAHARVTVSGDTGVMHMSTAVSTPVVALFGPTAKPFGFFPYRAKSTVLELDLPCRPCSKMGGSACPLGHHRCLVDISPEDVETAVRRWL